MRHTIYTVMTIHAVTKNGQLAQNLCFSVVKQEPYPKKKYPHGNSTETGRLPSKNIHHLAQTRRKDKTTSKEFCKQKVQTSNKNNTHKNKSHFTTYGSCIIFFSHSLSLVERGGMREKQTNKHLN